jgi:hypothetical protein
MEVIKEEPHHEKGGVGRCAGAIVFDQGASIFTEVNGVYTYYQYVRFNPSIPPLLIRIRRAARARTRIRIHQSQQ